MAAQQQQRRCRKKSWILHTWVFVLVCVWSLLLLLSSYASFYYFVDFLYSNSSSHTETERNDAEMNILHLSIVVYIGNGDGVGALRRRRSDVAASAAYTHAHIHMNMSYLSIILFCISDAVFRFAFFSANCFASFWAISHKHIHTCIFVLFCSCSLRRRPLSLHSLFAIPGPAAAAARRVVVASTTVRSLPLALVLSQWFEPRFRMPNCCCCCCCSAYSSAATVAVVVISPSGMPAAPSLVVVVVFAAFHGCCLSYSESAN